MAPTISSTVIFKQGEHEEPINGTREHPAIVTRVWDNNCVNLMVFFDGYMPQPRTSIVPASTAGTGPAWDWPPRDESEQHCAGSCR